MPRCEGSVVNNHVDRSSTVMRKILMRIMCANVLAWQPRKDYLCRLHL